MIFSHLFFWIGIAIGMPILALINKEDRCEEYNMGPWFIFLVGGMLVFLASILIALIFGGMIAEESL